MKNEQITLGAKDLLVVLKLAFGDSGEGWTYQSLAGVLGLSPSQVHSSTGRLIASGLLNGKGLKGKVHREALANFIIHGARYIFPPVFGKPGRGIPTGVSSSFFEAASILKGEDMPWVWLHPEGSIRGSSLAPIHPSALEAIKHDSGLHKALVHLDALRIGRARERNAAEEFFRKSLAWRS